MTLKLYDTLTREKRLFVPTDPARVTMYVCGPTVYGFAHIGNARPVVAFDVLFRLLRHLYGADHVVYARNVTDVDDKINQKAADEGVDISVITERYLAAYLEDMDALGALRPTHQPKATDYIQAMVEDIAGLITRGGAYEAEGHVLFDTQAARDYGMLSGRSLDDMIAGARVEVAPYKRHPADFVLWKPSKPHEPRWPSPWGDGRPGWHSECSTMIERVLGLPIDIHGGGIDLVFPHHENELAQARCAHDGAEFARYWMHNGFLDMAGEKMSKSLGNVIIPHELLQRVPGEVVRWALLSAHYRQPLDWTEKLLRQGQRVLDRLYRALFLARRLPLLDHVGPDQEIIAALSDDLNTPKAIARLSELAKQLNSSRSTPEGPIAKALLVKSGELLGFLQSEPREWILRGAIRSIPRSDIDMALRSRRETRAERDYDDSDDIRDYLRRRWIEVQDSKLGQEWKPVQSFEVVERAARIAASSLAENVTYTGQDSDWGVDAVGVRGNKTVLFQFKSTMPKREYLSKFAEILSEARGRWGNQIRAYLLVPDFNFRAIEARSIVRDAHRQGIPLRIASFDGAGITQRMIF